LVTCRHVPGLKYVKLEEPRSGATRKKYGVIKETEMRSEERKIFKIKENRETEATKEKAGNALGDVSNRMFYASVHIHYACEPWLITELKCIMEHVAVRNV
jgi:hypothetical protein